MCDAFLVPLLTEDGYFRSEGISSFRRLLRSVVGPPGGMDWTRPWHEILHVWNGRVHEQKRLCVVETWSKKCLNAHLGNLRRMLFGFRTIVGWFVHYIGSRLLPPDVWDDLLLPDILQSRVSVGGAG